MQQISGIVVPEAELDQLCRKYRVKELSVFGSRARADNRPDSDLDLLVEFLPDTVLGLIGYGRFRDELSQLFGVDVDLAPRHGLKPIVQHYALPDIKPLYEAS
jgi:predicted nucleotidyltransferase